MASDASVSRAKEAVSSPITRARRKCTPRWYCRTTLIDASTGNTATTTPETVRNYGHWVHDTTSIGVDNVSRAQRGCC